MLRLICGKKCAQLVRYLSSKENRKLIRKTPIPNATKLASPYITSKLEKFNLSVAEAQKYTEKTKFGDIPLASWGWKHYKSKNDYFTIHPIGSPNDIDGAQPFGSLPIDEHLLRNISSMFGISKASYVQCESFPLIQSMEHVIMAAETGCGKTLAYLVPLVQQILERKANESEEQRKMNSPLALVLTPGRELAEQIGNVADQLCTNLNVNVKVLVGGRMKQLITNPEFDNVDIVIGSIGAVSKLITTSIYRVNHVRHVILDEVDTLLDDSFNPKLVYMLRRFPFHKNHLDDANITGTQLIMVGATMPTNTNDILRPIIDPNTIRQVISPNLHHILPHVRQTFLRMRKISRPIQMLSLVKKSLEKKRPVLIFGNKSTTSDFASLFLNDHGIECVNLNGDMLQKIRAGRFESFQRGEVHVLSTTDVASRGLDTTRVRHIINFDFPLHTADYIHRIGRIGRFGSHEQCEVTNFVSSLREIEIVQKIEHAARTNSCLPNVNANITNLIQTQILANEEKEQNIYLKSLNV